MNAREAFGAIPLVGTFVGLVTLIKTTINEHLSPTDRKIRTLLASTEQTSDQKLNQLQSMFAKKFKPVEPLDGLTPEGKTSNEIYTYYRALIKEQSIDKHNARWELIPFAGTVHHLFLHSDHLHTWKGSRTSIDAQAAIHTLTLLGKLKEAEWVRSAHQNFLDHPNQRGFAPPPPTPQHLEAKSKLITLIAHLLQPIKVDDALIEKRINAGCKGKFPLITETQAEEIRDTWKRYQENPDEETGLKLYRMLEFCFGHNYESLPDWKNNYVERMQSYRTQN